MNTLPYSTHTRNDLLFLPRNQEKYIGELSLELPQFPFYYT